MKTATTQPPRMFDSARYRGQLQRARHGEVAPVLDALYGRAADNLLDIKRRFARITTIGLHDDAVRAALAEVGYETEIAPVPERWMEDETLPLAPESCEAILCVFGLHAVNDLVGTLIQIKRALTPDGMLMALMPGPATLQELRDAMAQIEVQHFGGIAPRIAPFLEIRDAGNLLGRAGFALPVIDSEMLQLHYSSLKKLHADLRHAGQTNMLAARNPAALPRKFYKDLEDYYRAHYASEEGALIASLEVVSLTAWSPHESQQKPAKRGSGDVSLADFLK